MKQIAATLAALPLALMATCSPAPAQEAPGRLELAAPCHPRAIAEAHLSEAWQEAPAARAVTLEGFLVEVWTSAAGETWTLLIHTPEGMSCTLSAGEFWMHLRAGDGV